MRNQVRLYRARKRENWRTYFATLCTEIRRIERSFALRRCLIHSSNRRPC